MEALGVLGGLAALVVAIALFLLAVLMPWYVYRTAKWTHACWVELRKLNERATHV